VTKTAQIAVDAMGGDGAPATVINGANLAATRHAGPRFTFFGDRDAIEPLLGQAKALAGRADIVHTETVISGEAKPATALRRGRKSSMGLAIRAVADGTADAVISAGNTGALMAMAKFSLRMLPGIHRPAITGVFPSRRGPVTVLDLGANIECSASNLVEFAAMGAVFAQTVLGRANPTVGILDVGKGVPEDRVEVREAAAILRKVDSHFVFHGLVAGDDILAGTTDVVVTDGFTGNITLKTAEGTLRMQTEYLRRVLSGSWAGRLGYGLARPALRALREKIDPRRYNGAMFLGLNGTVVKSHGGTDAFGFATAMEVAIDMVEGSVNQRIIEELEQVHRNRAPDREPALAK